MTTGLLLQPEVQDGGPIAFFGKTSTLLDYVTTTQRVRNYLFVWIGIGLRAREPAYLALGGVRVRRVQGKGHNA